MILVDTNILVALADRSDTYHDVCQAWLGRESGHRGFPATVLAEACYLIDRFGGPEAEARFLDAVGDGPLRRFRVIDLVDDDLRRMTGLVRQYADRRFGSTDASIVAVAERLGIHRCDRQPARLRQCAPHPRHGAEHRPVTSPDCRPRARRSDGDAPCVLPSLVFRY